MDFKVTYLDACLSPSSYHTEGDISANTNGSSNSNHVSSNSGSGSSSTKTTRKFKSHMRDFLGGPTRKRKNAVNTNDIYHDTAALTPYASVYTTPGGVANSHYAAAAASAAVAAESPLYLQQQNLAASHYQSIYPVDNRYFPSEYLAASYRSLSSYYPEYTYNSYFDVSAAASPRPPYDPQLRYFDDKSHECKYPFQPESQKSLEDHQRTGTPGAPPIGVGTTSKRDDKKSQHAIEVEVEKGVKCEPVNVSYDYVSHREHIDHQW